MNTESKIFVTGHRGLVGQALLRQLDRTGFKNIITAHRADLDLRDEYEVGEFLAYHRPGVIFHAAAKVGGIMAHSERGGEFIRDNLEIQTNVIEAARRTGVKDLLFFGSACAYPKYAPCPIQESSLLCGELEETNRAYAIAKIAGIEMCRAYRKQFGVNYVSLMPTNLYGIGDNYHPQHSHVLPGMIRKIHEAGAAGEASVTLWGSGTATREFLFADDLARAAVLRMMVPCVPDLLNVGSGVEIKLRHLARIIANEIGYHGVIRWDNTKPDGTPRRVLDCTEFLKTGWVPSTSLSEGIRLAYKDFLLRFP